MPLKLISDNEHLYEEKCNILFLRISQWDDHITNDDIMDKFNIYNLCCLGHVHNMQDNMLPKHRDKVKCDPENSGLSLIILQISIGLRGGRSSSLND